MIIHENTFEKKCWKWSKSYVPNADSVLCNCYNLEWLGTVEESIRIATFLLRKGRLTKHAEGIITPPWCRSPNENQQLLLLITEVKCRVSCLPAVTL